MSKAKNLKSRARSNLIGACVMAALILVSLPLGVNRSFSRLREDVESEYYYDSTGYAIYEGIDTRVDAAKNLITLGEEYEDTYPELDDYVYALTRSVNECRNAYFYDIQDIDEEVECNEEMGAAAQALAEKLDSLELSEKDEKYPSRLLADMQSEQDKLERSSFNDKAEEYNAKLRSFPISLLKGLAGLKEIATF